MKKFVIIAILLIASVAFAQNGSPVVFYSDLTSGPNAGGQNNAGAYVTLRGKGFGATRGNSVVTIGGASAASYQSWSDTEITFQPGRNARSGNILVDVGGDISNGIQFSVSRGNIYFVSNSGNDSNAGTFAEPWQTPSYATSKMQPGDIVYLSAGTYSTNLTLSRSGNVSAAMAMVAYPGSSATLSANSGASVNITGSNWVLAGLTLRGAVLLTKVSGIRLVNGNVSCAAATNACIAAQGGSSISLLGNHIHGVNVQGVETQAYDSVSLQETNNVEIGWNQIRDAQANRAVVLESADALQHSVLVHDNFIYGSRCDAVALNTVDAAQGAVKVYNNIIRNAGTGPVAGGSSGDCGYAAIHVGGSSEAAVEVYDNTIYDAGAFGGVSAGAVSASGAVTLTNNIFYMTSHEQYVSLSTDLSNISGAGNLFYGAGNPLGIFSSSVTADPKFVAPAANDFHLAADSPAIGSGVPVELATDFEGTPRQQGTVSTSGALEALSSSRNRVGTLSASPTSVTFSNAVIGQSYTATVTLKNSGATEVTLDTVASSNKSFTPSGLSLPMNLSAGESATLSVEFSPSTTGTTTGTIAVASNARNTPTNISVKGSVSTSSSPKISMSPTSLTFGSQAIATQSAAQSVTVTNGGTAALTISGIAASGDFTQTNNCTASLAANATCTVTVTFAPTATGTRTGAITFTDNAAGSPQSVALTGTGTAALIGSLQTSSTMSFGSITAGSSTSQSLTLTNNGTASLVLQSITTSNSAFTVSGVTLPATVAAGASVTLTVNFAPSAAGSYSATLSIQSNASDSALSVALTGTATEPAHSVTLTWSESGTVSGYNVYRSTQSGTGYSKVNSSLVPNMSYVDSSVTGGQTYYYVVTAVNASGVESAYSSQATAIVPAP